MGEKELFKNVKAKIRPYWGYQLLLLVILFSVFFFTLIKSIDSAFSRLGYELTETTNWDSSIYEAVGKGMTSGLLPYQDLYETKPPMIFFLAAISYALTKNFYMLNILSFLFIVLTGLCPFIYALVSFIRNKEKDLIYSLGLFLATLLLGLLFMDYDENRAGEIQVEAFGAFFASVYLFIISLQSSNKLKAYSPTVFISAFFLMMTVMLKEPFLLVCLGTSLLFIKSKKDLLYKMALPILYGGIMGVVLLACTSTLVPYITIYLKDMLFNHISIYGSPIKRGLDFLKVYNDVGGVSSALQGIIIILLSLAFIKDILRKPQTDKAYLLVIYKVFDIVKVPLAIYLASFSVGLGGQYYNHHYIFALPLYISLTFVFIDSLNELDAFINKNPVFKPDTD